MINKSKSNRTYRTKSIADIAGSINNRTFARYGFAKSDIILHWSEIVGSVLARSSLPERLIMPKSNEKEGRAGVLHIRVEGSFAPEMQHLEPLVIDRINSYYGFKAVERLIFHHGNVATKTLGQKYKPPILSDSQKNELDLMLKDVKDDQLRASLFKVGAELAAKPKTQKTKQAKRFTRRGQGSAL